MTTQGITDENIFILLQVCISAHATISLTEQAVCLGHPLLLVWS